MRGEGGERGSPIARINQCQGWHQQAATKRPPEGGEEERRKRREEERERGEEKNKAEAPLGSKPPLTCMPSREPELGCP